MMHYVLDGQPNRRFRIDKITIKSVGDKWLCSITQGNVTNSFFAGTLDGDYSCLQKVVSDNQWKGKHMKTDLSKLEGMFNNDTEKAAAISFAYWAIGNDDMKASFTKDTGIKFPDYEPPKTVIEQMIDIHTGYYKQEENEEVVAKFLLWALTDFLKGFRDPNYGEKDE